jgi:hypothetical protein
MNCACSIAGETINDITDRVLYDDGRFGVLWRAIFAEIVDNSPRIFNRSGVAWQLVC